MKGVQLTRARREWLPGAVSRLLQARSLLHWNPVQGIDRRGEQILDMLELVRQYDRLGRSSLCFSDGRVD